jgi:hypothetical protein
MDPAGPKELETHYLRVADPALERQPSGFGDLEPCRFARSALDHRGPLPYPPGGEDIANPESDKIATARLPVGGHVEQREAARVASHLETDPDEP